MPTRYLPRFVLLVGFLLVGLWGCDVPTPPPEALTPTVVAPGLQPTASTSPTPLAAIGQPAKGTIWFVRGDTLWANEIGGQEQQMSQRKITSPPSPSPDGMQVAYASDRDLVLFDRADKQEHVLYSGDLTDRQDITWSPDGKLLAFFTFDADNYGSEKAWQIPATGGDPKELATMDVRGYMRGPSFDRVARWSPDMRRIAVGSVYGPIQLIALAADAGSGETINGGEPDWAPDSRTMLYTESMAGGLTLYDVVSQELYPYYNEKRPVGTRLGEFAQAPFPRFDPSGTMLIYRSQVGDERPAVGVRGIGGDELLFVPGNNASWSPYDGWITFETGVINNTADGAEWQADGISIIDADGSGQTEIAKDARLPVWGR